MSDQGFYQRNINIGDTALQEFTEAGNINAAAQVANADTSSGAYTIVLPPAAASAGRMVITLNIDGANVLTVGVQTGESLNGIVDGTVATPAAPLSGLGFYSTGTEWFQYV